MFETRHIGKVVQQHQKFSNPLTDELAVLPFLITSSRPKYQIYCTSNRSAVVMSKSEFSNDFEGKIDFEAKNRIFAFFRLKLAFLLLRAKYQKRIVDKPTFKQHPHVAKAFIYPKHIFKHVEHHDKLIILAVKVDKPKST